MKRCPKCGEAKEPTEFWRDAKRADGLQIWCKPCLVAYKAEKGIGRSWYARNRGRVLANMKAEYARNPEHYRAKSHTYYHANREKMIARQTARQVVVRLGVLDAYGGRVCACCGETILSFLTIDHINGGGGEHRKETGGGSQFFRWLKNHGYPDGYQVLCFNCNLGRAVSGGICPHVAA